MKFCVGVVLHPPYRHNMSRLDLVLFLFQDFYHIRINFRAHDKYSFAETTLVITYTLIARGGGEVEMGGGGDQQKMLKVITPKCNIAILSKENVEKQILLGIGSFGFVIGCQTWGPNLGIFMQPRVWL